MTNTSHSTVVIDGSAHHKTAQDVHDWIEAGCPSYTDGIMVSGEAIWEYATNPNAKESRPEHLSKPDGYEVISLMQKLGWSKAKVTIKDDKMIELNRIEPSIADGTDQMDPRPLQLFKREPEEEPMDFMSSLEN